MDLVFIEIPHFVRFVTATKSWNLKNPGLIGRFKVPQFAGNLRKFPTLMVFLEMKPYHLRNTNQETEILPYLRLKVLREIPDFVGISK